jgi:hypothetical protein
MCISYIRYNPHALIGLLFEESPDSFDDLSTLTTALSLPFFFPLLFPHKACGGLKTEPRHWMPLPHHEGLGVVLVGHLIENLVIALLLESLPLCLGPGFLFVIVPTKILDLGK